MAYNLETTRRRRHIVSTRKNRRSPEPTTPPRERALLVGVGLPGQEDWLLEDSLNELAHLALTAGIEVVGQVSQRLRAPVPATFVGKGKIDEIAQLRSELNFGLIVFDDELTASQSRNLERSIGAPVIDRSELILQIFGRRARTHEGRLQVELAKWEYMLPRLTGQWTHLERQAGGTGTRGGPGETQLEVDRRYARHRIADLKTELERIRRHRGQHRQRRIEEGLPVAALVGYTNAGKSTLMNTLTSAGVLAEDKLFATLDPTTRQYVTPSGQRLLISDTVGFIQKLSPSLVAAFRATLEELESADVLLHVVDVTHPNGHEQSETVRSMLADLGIAERPLVTVLNKIDLLAAPGGATGASQVAVPEEARRMLDELTRLYPNAVAISAVQKWGLAALVARIEATLAKQWVPLTVRLPYSADRLIRQFREHGRITAEEYTPEGAILCGQVPQRYLSQFRAYVV